MKLSDVIDYSMSCWNSVGRSGGTSLPNNNKPTKVDGIDIWKRSKKKSRLNEYQHGPDYDWIDDEGAEQFNPGGRGETPPRYGSWANATRAGDSVISTGEGGRRKKIIVRRVGKNAIETLDDEGNRQLKGHTGNIDYTTAGMGARMNTGGQLVHEVQTGTGLGGTGATMPPTPQPNTVVDLKRAREEMRCVDTKSEAKTSKKKRKELFRYLDKRLSNKYDYRLPPFK